jgi:hypothetical protein
MVCAWGVRKLVCLRRSDANPPLPSPPRTTESLPDGESTSCLINYDFSYRRWCMGRVSPVKVVWMAVWLRFSRLSRLKKYAFVVMIVKGVTGVAIVRVPAHGVGQMGCV